MTSITDLYHPPEEHVRQKHTYSLKFQSLKYPQWKDFVEIHEMVTYVNYTSTYYTNLK